MSWTAIVPFRNEGDRKTRLAGLLDTGQRERLAAIMFAHVTATLATCPRIGSILPLSRAKPPHWQGDWNADGGLGLNPELEAARETLGAASLLVIHADLPLLALADIEVLLDAAEAQGCAIASDRAGTGTNAVALRGGPAFAFRFGFDSFRLHTEQGPIAIVKRPGLALDIDTPDDLVEARAAGFTAFT